MPPQVSATVSVRESYSLGDDIIITYKLKNQSPNDVYVLRRNTPLEGLRSDCLVILREGADRVKYDGPLVKRGPIVQAEFALVRAGEEVSSDVRVADAYALDRAGRYTITLKSPTVNCVPASDAELTKAMSVGRSRDLQTAAADIQPVEIMVGDSDRAPYLTEGQRARESESKEEVEGDDEGEDEGREFAVLDAVAGPKKPKIKGGSSNQRTAVSRAHRDAYKITDDAVESLDNDGNYREWFGTFTTQRSQRVEEVFTNVRDRMISTRFIYNLTGDGCGPSDYAYTYHESRTIWLCSVFWSAPPIGTASKAGTILHEHTHATADVDDIAYGQEDCRQLAIDDPDDAIENADSYEFFAGG